jgi:cytochrome c553
MKMILASDRSQARDPLFAAARPTFQPGKRARSIVALLSLLSLPLGSALAQSPSRDDASSVDFFEKKVRPILANNCYTCHSADTNSKGGLRVDDRNGLLQGGGKGPAVVPGHPDKSLLVQRITQTDEKLRMPLEGQLKPEEIAVLTAWIQNGAAWPAVKVPDSINTPKPEYQRLRKKHWAWQALRLPQVPPVQDTSWPRSDIDRFVLAGLEERGLKPVGDADRTTLIRRLTFDLTGLPPTPDETAAFVDDAAPDSLAKVVDRLLASPAFGERWGRHWLDVARYGESTGSSRNVPYPHAWRYRDYVIDSVGADKPYDRFLIEQIAGDLLPAESARQRDEQLIATGFLALGVKDVNQRFKPRFVMDNIDEQIDTVTRSILGLTASCARCHDHKFDPIPTTDYYALAGIFHSTDNCAGVRNKMGGGGLDYYDKAMLLEVTPWRDPDPRLPEKIEQAKLAAEQARAELEAIRGTAEGREKGSAGKSPEQIAQEKLNRLNDELAALTDPGVQGRAAIGVRESKSIGDTEIRIRGEAEKTGPPVHRGFLTAFEVPGARSVNPEQSGRLELALWLTSAKNPLTSRVMANRVWQHLFGAGLAASVDNFGVTGDAPSHPQLLDYLALRFIQDGWSVKGLVRSIVLSRAYQLGPDAPRGSIDVDPANRLVWRHSPRRLDAEEIRDAMLAAAGMLNLNRPEASPARDMKVIELQDDGPEARRLRAAADDSRCRSVYLPLLRGLTPRSLEVFDFAEQGMVTGNRDSTTVPAQALYMLNSPFVRRQSLNLSERLLRQEDLDQVGRIRSSYRLALGRQPTAREVERARAYLAEYEAAALLIHPEDAQPPGETIKEETIRPGDAKTAAWMSFCQALLGSAEFRFVR